MTDGAYNGYFLIADITGYTQFLSHSELEHAQGTLTDLLNLLIGETRPPLIISRLAGDAVISYGLEDHFFSGQTFLEMIENTYIAFRRTIDLMVLNTTCKCNACANIHALDLKFFVHHGSFGIQKLDGHDELVGSDVIVIHRMLKNNVTEKTGLRAYALYSDAAIRKLGLEEISKSMVFHEEYYEHIGSVALWVQDMVPAWEAKKDTVDLGITPDDILLYVDVYIDLPVERTWDYITRTEFRSILIGSDRQEIDKLKNGRVDAGSVYVCYHGPAIRLQIIRLWQPFNRIVVEAPMPPPNTYVYFDFLLEPEGDGTRLTQVTTRPMSGPVLARWMISFMMSFRRKEFAAKIQAFKNAVEAHAGRLDLPAEGANFSQEQIAMSAAMELKQPRK